MTNPKRILIGKIASAHGIKGDVKVVCHADDPEILFREDGVYTSETGDKRLVLNPRSEPKPNLFIASVDGVGDRNASELLRGTMLYIDRDELPELDDGQIYHTDLEGMDAVSADGKKMGRVIRVVNFGASDLLEIQGAKESYYIPFCEPYLVEVDMDGRRVVLNEPDVM